MTSMTRYTALATSHSLNKTKHHRQVKQLPTFSQLTHLYEVLYAISSTPMFSILSLVLSALNTTYSVPVLYRCIFPVISNNVFFSFAMAIDSCKIQNKSRNESVYFTHIKETTELMKYLQVNFKCKVAFAKTF